MRHDVALPASADAPAPSDITPRQSETPRMRSGLVRVLLVACVGALLVGFAGYTASIALTPDAQLPHTMCVDSTCTYAMSATGGVPVRPAQQHRRSAPERLVRKVLFFCHLGGR